MTCIGDILPDGLQGGHQGIFYRMCGYAQVFGDLGDLHFLFPAKPVDLLPLRRKLADGLLQEIFYFLQVQVFSGVFMAVRRACFQFTEYLPLRYFSPQPAIADMGSDAEYPGPGCCYACQAIPVDP